MKQETLLIDFINKYAASPLCDTVLERLDKHYQALLQWKKVFNIIGVNDRGEIFESLYLDSVISSQLLIRSIGTDLQRFCDVGSGAGFPGLVIPLFCTDITYTTLHEHRRKKASFLKTAIREMGLKNVAVSANRVTPGLFKADLVTSRATFQPKEWISLAATLIDDEGFIAAYLAGDETAATDEFVAGVREHARIKYALPVSGRLRELAIYKKSKGV